EETPVWPDGEVDRSGECPRPDQPTRGKVLGLRGGAVQAHADDLVARRGRPIPGSVEGDEEVPAVLGRELRAGVEGEAEGRAVRLVLEARARDLLAALGRAQVRIDHQGSAGPVAVGP